jgi:D-sedoheptulose 7-phosphate isomerase
MMRTWTEILAEHTAVMAALDEQGPTLERIADVVADCLHSGGRVYTLGNGGSAADAQHIAAELLGRFKRERAALPALALSTDSSTLTAIGNDLGYDQVFARQLAGLAHDGDVVWILSTSGNSPNVLAAARVAGQKGATVVGFTGQTGGQLGPLCRLLFRVPHAASDRIQEAHVLGYHYICERVEATLAAR